MKDLFENISDYQRKQISDRLTMLTQFVNLCRQFPDHELPAEVSTACRESADFAAFLIIDLCALISGMSEEQRAFMSHALDNGLSYDEMFENLAAFTKMQSTEQAEA
jgi:hypothetical protein